jgi:hypothetical protein
VAAKRLRSTSKKTLTPKTGGLRRAAKINKSPARGTPPAYVGRAMRTNPGSGENVETSQTRDRLTLHLPVSLAERARNAVYWTPGLTMTELVASALTEALDRRERKRGEPFPLRKGSLRIGRPVKTF